MPMCGRRPVRLCGQEQSRRPASVDKSNRSRVRISPGRLDGLPNREPDHVHEPARNPSVEDSSDPYDRKPVGGKAARTDGRTKATLLLPESVDFRLTTIAASLKSDRSTLATQLLDTGLRRFALDAALRQHTGVEGPPESDGAGEQDQGA